MNWAFSHFCTWEYISYYGIQISTAFDQHCINAKMTEIVAGDMIFKME